ncbi:MAG: hypothetical protein ACRC2O_05700, partial [Chitinophagaceae bacterium]
NAYLLMMFAVLTVVRYPSRFIYFAIIAMALFRFPLYLNKKMQFHKLLGCGKNGSFDIKPDWNQWAILVFMSELPDLQSIHEKTADIHTILYGPFISKWWNWFNCETWTITLELIDGHGSWDGKKLFSEIKDTKKSDGPVAVLTRATIKLSKVRDFWQNVAPVSNQMKFASGLITSVGIGEMPLLRQATFSIWESMDHMKSFAYSMHEHREVIKKTRKEKWYSEDMFLRFRPMMTFGSLKGQNPFPMD